jgi:dUTP pyrophosphatase
MMSNVFATLKLFVKKECPELIEMYRVQVQKHNESVQNNSHPNAGFDLLFPEETTFPVSQCKSKFINFQVKGQMLYDDKPTGYYMYPRSSLSKTPLMLANHTGVVDSGYTGFLLGAFRNLYSENGMLDTTNSYFTVKKNERLLQICHPLLCPIIVELFVLDEDDNHELLGKTLRGDGGFGSTGK